MTNTNPATANVPTTAPRRRWPFRVLLVVVAMVALGIADLVITWLRYSPAIRELERAPAGLTNQMRRSGLGTPPAWTPLDRIPGVLACAVLLAEDQRFHEYRGVDWSRQRQIARRVIRGDLRYGGSGMAQQLARNLYLAPTFTPRRKVREWLLAINISRTLSRERQLEVYLNVAQWGPEAWGVAQGAFAMLGKSLDAITPSDAVLMALALPAPTREFDYTLHPARRARMERLSQQLWERGVLSDAEAAATSARLHQWVAATATTGSPDLGRRQMMALTGTELHWRGPAMPALGCTGNARWGS